MNEKAPIYIKRTGIALLIFLFSFFISFVSYSYSPKSVESIECVLKGGLATLHARKTGLVDRIPLAFHRKYLMKERVPWLG